MIGSRMDACRFGFLSFILTLLCATFAPASAHAATFVTTNFIVNAPTKDSAKQIGQAAERYRKELAILWLEKEMPRWGKRCPIKVKLGKNMGAGGATTFSFLNGEVFGWKMNVQGSLERVLDSVIPHEITHTILACHFRRPLPRWADEGVSTLIEHQSEKAKQIHLLKVATRENRRIPLRRLFALTEYPSRMKDVMTLYAEGFTLVDYLVQKKGRRRFLKFLEDALESNWDDALKRHYQITSVETLEKTWDNWLIAGRPALKQPTGTVLASTTQPANLRPLPSARRLAIRGQAAEKENRVIPIAFGNSNSDTHADSPSSPRVQKDRSTMLSHPIYRRISTLPPNRLSRDSQNRNALNPVDPFSKDEDSRDEG